MSRCVAQALVLVNWKGVFYERYLLDRHVTALEGENGAGKTTVMIAAFVALLPDLSKLRFVNLGETAGTGGDRGIWGRLGHEGPAYCALEVALGAGESALCGVYLERKAAPSLTLTPFVVRPVPAGGSGPLLLERSEEHEEVVPFHQLAERSAAMGAEFEPCATAKDYFAILFELGVSSLRLDGEEERNKFGEMLRTSMTGGISRVLTTELRSFLFREQSGLLGTLRTIRESLESCRRTRLEVVEARALQREIEGIFLAGQGMLSAAWACARARLAAAEKEAAHAEAQERALREEERSCQARVEELVQRRASFEGRLALATQRVVELAALVERLERAAAVVERLARAEAEVAQLGAGHEAAQAQQREAAEARAAARDVRGAAQQTLKRAAAGLSDLESGLEELHRRSHEHRRALAGKARIEAKLGPGAAAPERLSASLERARAERNGLDRAAAELDRRRASAADRAEQWRIATEALASLTAGAPGGADLAGQARGVLARLDRLESTLADQAELRREHGRLVERAERRERLLSSLAGLVESGPADAGSVLAQLQRLEEDWRRNRRLSEEAGALHGAMKARLEAAEQRLELLRGTRHEYEQCRAAAARYAAAAPEEPAPTPESLPEQLRTDYEMLEAARAELGAAEAEQSLCAHGLGELDREVSAPPPELVELVERVGGQRLCERYEGLQPEEARRVEARLGPWVGAIVVADPHAAASLARRLPRPAGDLYFSSADRELPLAHADRSAVAVAEEPPADEPGEGSSEVVVVEGEYGVRLSPLPAAASLGRRARQQRIEQLRTRHSAAEQRRLAASRSLEQLRERIQCGQALAALSHSFRRGDPSAELEQVSERIRACSQECEQAHEQQCGARIEMGRLEPKLSRLRALLPDLQLLDGGEEAERARSLAERLEHADRARLELEETAGARRRLRERLDVLALGAPHEAARGGEGERLQAERDEWFAVIEALEHLRSSGGALQWSDAERALSEREQLQPRLSAQLEAAERHLAEAEASVAQRDGSWERSTQRAHEAAAQLSAAQAHRQRARAELEELSVGEPRRELVDETLRRRAAAEAELASVRHEEKGLETDLAVQRERAAGLGRALEHASAVVSRARPALQLAERCVGELEALASPVEFEPLGAESASAEEALARARAERRLLSERLGKARGGADLGAALAGEEMPASPVGLAQDWLRVRDWLMGRLPAPVAELGDPRRGLARLRSDLGRLEGRLEQQEAALCGTSADVARSIDVQVRKAVAQVRRLSELLSGVAFGSLEAMRVRIDRVERMEQVLAALRDGETQELLFQSNLPVEEALDEIFRRHGGGRGGGERLLDFRQYIELFVEIRRRGSRDWQRVNPTQVSTGEAIGVGAALMMVVLAEWEREGNLMRRRRAHQPLRFLFLDEANRLSQDSLGVLFELCHELDLQLLLAAPEVATRDGNTTYHLVRRIGADGEEEVVVSGRRSVAPPPPAESEPGPRPAQQSQLFQ